MLRIQSVCDFSNRNTNNHYEWAPYIDVNGVLAIDSDWWMNDLNDNQREYIRSVVSPIRIEKVSVPHEDRSTAIVTRMYHAYIETFNMEKWSRNPFVSLSNDVKQAMSIYETMGHSDESLLKHEEVKEVVEQLNKLMNGRKCFVRALSSSGKNVRPVKPFTSASDAFLYLAGNRYLNRIDWSKKDVLSGIVVQEWNEQIDRNNEFRVFLHRGKVVAMSTQYFYTNAGSVPSDVAQIAKAIIESSAVVNSPYSTAVIDMCVINGQAVLLEYNPFGASSGAGSGLYSWIEEWNILHGDESEIYFRFPLSFQVDYTEPLN
jgi:hypothetical protein